MPEGDTIFRAARTLARALTGKVVTRFETAYAHLATVDADQPVAGRTVEEVRAVGKHLLMRFSGPGERLVLRTHMRMNGSWHIYRPGERWQRPRQAMRVLVETADFVAVAFDVPVAVLETEAALERDQQVTRLGPDLLGPTFDDDEALRRLRAAPERAIGEALIDQSAVAGAGNVYKSETLFLCGISPFTPVADLPDERLRALLATARRLLGLNVKETAPGGIVTYFGLRRAKPEDGRWVYGRAGRPCRRCGTAIILRRQGLDARLSYSCPRCQPDPVPDPVPEFWR
jgi:endonuclease-8